MRGQGSHPPETKAAVLPRNPILSFSAAVRFRFRLRSPALISPVRRVATEPGKLPTYFSRAQSVAGSRIEPKTQMIRSEFQGLLFPRLWTNSTTSVRASRHWASPARPATRKADLLRIIGNSFAPSSRTREARAAFRPTFLTSPTSRWARTAGDQPLGIDRVFAHKADRGDLSDTLRLPRPRLSDLVNNDTIAPIVGLFRAQVK